MAAQSIGRGRRAGECGPEHAGPAADSVQVLMSVGRGRQTSSQSGL